MSNFFPEESFPVPIRLLNPSTTNKKASPKKVYPNAENGDLLYCSFKTYGGTEVQNNGVYSVEDTANITTWYRPDIRSDSRIALANNTDVVYEVIGEPENINIRNQFCKFKVKRIKGGV